MFLKMYRKMFLKMFSKMFLKMSWKILQFFFPQKRIGQKVGKRPTRGRAANQKRCQALEAGARAPRFIKMVIVFPYVVFFFRGPQKILRECFQNVLKCFQNVAKCSKTVKTCPEACRKSMVLLTSKKQNYMVPSIYSETASSRIIDWGYADL